MLNMAKDVSVTIACMNEDSNWSVRFTRRHNSDVFIDLMWSDKETPTHSIQLTAEEWEQLQKDLRQ